MSKLLVSVGAAILVSSAAMANAPSLAAPTSSHANFVDVADDHVAYEVEGSGRPVIVMITGLGDDMSTFKGAVAKLRQSATVITYDRRGYGRSTANSDALTSNNPVEDLDAVLQHSGIPGPYIIVGHSLGGLIAEQFAARHPEKVAGLVLEESRPAVFGPQCEAAGIKACTPTPQTVRSASLGTRLDVAGLEAIIREVAAIRPSAELPVLVLSRELAKRPSAFESVWAGAQSELAHRYAGGVQRIAPTNRHYVHRAALDWFCAAIMDFAKMTTDRGRG